MGAHEAELAKLQDELATVARSIARLLSKPRYDEAELDVRAAALRRAIRERRPMREWDGA